MQKVVVISNQGMSAADVLEIARHNAEVKLRRSLCMAFQLDSEHWPIDMCRLNSARSCSAHSFVRTLPELGRQLSAK
jgi:hypothetical protein